MSALSFYNSSLPTLDRALGNLEHVLKKGEANAEDDEATFIEAQTAEGELLPWTRGNTLTPNST